MRNPWRYNLDVSSVFHNDALSFAEVRDGVVKLLRNSQWFAVSGGSDTALDELVTELSEADDVEEFDGIWNDIYDLADADRCWIITR